MRQLFIYTQCEA